MTSKFSDQDRKLVIDELERIQNIKLEQVKPSRKLYRDANGMFYLVSGGAEDWHGINANVMQTLALHNQEGAFVVAKKYKTKMDVCVGSLAAFLQNKDKLLTTKQGVFLQPVKCTINNKEQWRWVAVGFEDDSFYNGEVINPNEYAESVEDLITTDLQE